MQSAVLVSPHYFEYSYEYASALQKQYDVTLVADSDAVARESEGTRRQFSPGERLTIETDDLRRLGALARCISVIGSKRPAFVHLQEASGFRKAIVVLLLSLWCRFIARLPLVLTIHDPTPHTGRDSRIASRLMLLRSWARQLASAVVVHGRYCLEAYRGSAPAGQILVESSHGVILADDETGETDAAPAPYDFLMFGRMEQYKGLEVLLESLRLLKAAGADASLALAGGGPELDRLHDDFKALGARIFRGYIPRDELLDVLRASAVVLAPYVEATQSGVVAASFANGRPVIATDVGGLADVVVDNVNGRLIPPGDPQSLAAAMRQLKSTETLARLTTGARATASGPLAWDHIVAKLLAELAPLLDPTGRKR